jgi:ubiquinone/menaquinone biosynthesis C-methylase UbiE
MSEKAALGVKKYLFGIQRETIPDIAFRMMSATIRLREIFLRASNRLEEFGIQPGDIVIDYGCGPGMYIEKAAGLVGELGSVYAVDIHPLAIQATDCLIQKRGLTNVKSVQAHGYQCPVNNNCADLIYALDMFHMIEEPGKLLGEFHRLIKPGGILIIDDGHQPRTETRQKIAETGLWALRKEKRGFLKYTPGKGTK